MKRLLPPKGLENIIALTPSEVFDYIAHEMGERYIIPLKVPREKERFLDDGRHYIKSNLNVCYAAPRSVGKPRNWYEMQLTVPTQTRNQAGYPKKGIPFFAVTDDGYGILLHTTSENNKQIAPVGNDRLLGKWFKGRLIEDGWIFPVDNTQEDKERRGMVTREILEAYGCDAIVLRKTDLRVESPDNPLNSYEVWTMKLDKIGDEW